MAQAQPIENELTARLITALDNKNKMGLLSVCRDAEFKYKHQNVFNAGYIWAQCLYHLGRFESAKDLLMGLLQQLPTGVTSTASFKYRVLLAHVLIYTNAPKEAMRFIHETPDSKHIPASSSLLIAEMYLESGLPEKALSFITSDVREDDKVASFAQWVLSRIELRNNPEQFIQDACAQMSPEEVLEHLEELSMSLKSSRSHGQLTAAEKEDFEIAKTALKTHMSKHKLSFEDPALEPIVLSNAHYDRLIEMLKDTPPIAGPLLKGRDYIKSQGLII